MACKILSLNVRGLQNSEKRRAIFDKHRIHADLMFLHETHSTKNCQTIWENEWGGKIYFSHGTQASKGIALLIKKDFVHSISNVKIDEDGRFIVVDLTLNQEVISVLALYANEDNPNFFMKLASLMRERSEHKIVLGDYNLTLNVQWIGRTHTATTIKL